MSTNIPHPPSLGIRWTLGDVGPRGYEALRLAIWGAWNLFGNGAEYAVCCNSVPLPDARGRTGDLPPGVRWHDVTADVPAFLKAHFREDMAEGVGWKFAPLRLFPDQFELSLDNDCILWAIPPAIAEWLKSARTHRCVVAEDVCACFGQFADLCGPEPRNGGLRGFPPGFDFERALRDVLAERPVVMTSELDEQGLQAAAMSRHADPYVVPVDQVTICSPFWPHRDYLGTCGAHFVGLNARHIRWNYFDRPADEWMSEHWERHRGPLYDLARPGRRLAAAHSAQSCPRATASGDAPHMRARHMDRKAGDTARPARRAERAGSQAGTVVRPNGIGALPLFRSPFTFLGGFECSSHINSSGRRLDLVDSTAHDRFALQDYARLRDEGIQAARDGIRWHLIEKSPYRYDFSSTMDQLAAARATGTQVIWDLCHYGWPNDLNVCDDEFIRRFAALARAFTRLLTNETDDVPYLAPINEISFLAWAGGAMALFPPFLTRRGRELKRHLVRAALAACDAVWEERPDARIFHIDPICNVVPNPDTPHNRLMARRFHLAQFHVWDMIAGHLRPELGGAPRYLDVIGVNYYPDNQWSWPCGAAAETTIDASHPAWRPLSSLLQDVHRRYRRPLIIAEAGAEDGSRPGWLRHVCDEVRRARSAGVPVEGICLYPVVNHAGWEDDRHCHNGLWDYPDDRGGRPIHEPLARELRRQQQLFSMDVACREAA